MDQADLPMPQLQQIVHHLLCAGAIVADHMVELPFLDVVIHDDDGIAPIGKVREEVMAIVAAERKNPIDVAALEQGDVLFSFDEIRLGLLEHDFIAELSGAI